MSCFVLPLNPKILWCKFCLFFFKQRYKAYANRYGQVSARDYCGKDDTNATSTYFNLGMYDLSFSNTVGRIHLQLAVNLGSTVCIFRTTILNPLVPQDFCATSFDTPPSPLSLPPTTTTTAAFFRKTPKSSRYLLLIFCHFCTNLRHASSFYPLF